MKKQFISIGMLIAALSLAPAHGAVLFSETYDANRLNGGAGVTLSGARAATVSGGTITFGNGTSGAEVFTIDIIGAGVLSESNQYNVTISVDEERFPGDQDHFYTLQSGNDYLGLQHADNDGGRFFYGNGLLSNTAPLLLSTFNAGSMFTGQNIEDWTAEYSVGLVDGIDLVTPDLASQTFNNLDVSQGLQFSFFGNGTTENYEFASISITVEGPAFASVPGPASLALMLIGLGWMGYPMRRWLAL